MKKVELTPEDIERFWAKVDRAGECWNWTASRQPSGYGQMKLNIEGKRSMALAHRLAFQIRHGRTPEASIDHMCHNRACVNPDHLREVTNKQNMENRRGANANSISGVRGATWYKPYKKWRAEVTHHGTTYSAGYHSTLESATAAVIAKRNELFTHNDADKAIA